MPAEISVTDSGFCVQGSVSFDNVVALRCQGEKLLAKLSQSKKSFVIDLTAMRDQDASPFSLLLCWMRFAEKKQCTLSMINASSSLQQMAKMFGLTKIIFF
ncbi:MAG: STAS domain-containing protein [Gammaproteobacteria bacterium]|nr:STAS domain-containing protein [Gammaproteobacteria bacterium]